MFYVDSGVPQGSVLGPILFLGPNIYKDLPGKLSHKFKLYVDDGKLLVELGNNKENDDMQTDIYKIVELCKAWSMELSTEKYKIINLSEQSAPKDYFTAEKNLRKVLEASPY